MSSNLESNNRPNPIGLNGIDFIEFTSPDPVALENLFIRLGMVKVGQHRRKNVTLYRQGRINFILNKETKGFAFNFANIHGPSICAMGVKVRDTKVAMALTHSRGGRPLEEVDHSFPGIYGIGESAIYFIEDNSSKNHFDEEFDYLSTVSNPKGLGLGIIDHLTNNVPAGEMTKWCAFYKSIFDFYEVRQFDIKGKATGLVSKVMRSPCGKITIPINEPTDQKSQIQEYLDEYHGSGIQHVALTAEDIVSLVTGLKENGIEFLDSPPVTYYEDVPKRVINVTENIKTLQDLAILCDGDEHGYLLQIFTKNLIGPIFFEVIQRKNHSGFGEGNFQALFDAIERDQKKRGYL